MPEHFAGLPAFGLQFMSEILLRYSIIWDFFTVTTAYFSISAYRPRAHISVMGESVHDAQCVVTALLHQ